MTQEKTKKSKVRNEKNVGIPKIEIPKDKCDDINCPFHGTLKVRGRIFEGVVQSIKPSRTVVVRWERRIFCPKYERFEGRFTKINAHRPDCLSINKNDTVIIGETRPISKSKKFVVLKKVEK